MPATTANLRRAIRQALKGTADATEFALDVIGGFKNTADLIDALREAIDGIDTSGGGGITELTGDVTAGPGTGSVAAIIAALAVTTAKIANLAVTTGKLAASAVTYAKIQDASTDGVYIGRAAGAGAGVYSEQALTALPAAIGLVPAWSVYNPPLVAGPKDDEVTGTTLNAQWTKTDGGSKLTVSVVNNQIVFSYAATAGQNNAWLYTAVPASEFAFIMTLRENCVVNGNYRRVGIAVFEDGANSAKKQDCIFYVPSLNQWIGANFASYNGAETARGTAITTGLFSAGFLRMRCNGTTCSADVSPDGESWYQHWTAVLTYTPQHFGPWMNNTSGNADTVQYKFCRTASGAGTSAFDGASSLRLGRVG